MPCETHVPLQHFGCKVSSMGLLGGGCRREGHDLRRENYDGPYLALLVFPLNLGLTFEMTTPRAAAIDACHPMEESAPHKPRAVLVAYCSRMQLTLRDTRPTSHGASRLAQALSAWSVKPRRATNSVPALHGCEGL